MFVIARYNLPDVTPERSISVPTRFSVRPTRSAPATGIGGLPGISGRNSLDVPRWGNPHFRLRGAAGPGGAACGQVTQSVARGYGQVTQSVAVRGGLRTGPPAARPRHKSPPDSPANLCAHPFIKFHAPLRKHCSHKYSPLSVARSDGHVTQPGWAGGGGRRGLRAGLGEGCRGRWDSGARNPLFGNRWPSRTVSRQTGTEVSS